MKTVLRSLNFVESVSNPMLFDEIVNGFVDFSQAEQMPNNVAINK
jgi:hypothetical protein